MLEKKNTLSHSGDKTRQRAHRGIFLKKTRKYWATREPVIGGGGDHRELSAALPRYTPFSEGYAAYTPTDTVFKKR